MTTFGAHQSGASTTNVLVCFQRVAKGEGPADLTVTMSDDVFFDVSQGKVTAQKAFLAGKIKIKGNMGMATKLGPVLQAAKPQARL